MNDWKFQVFLNDSISWLIFLLCGKNFREILSADFLKARIDRIMIDHLLLVSQFTPGHKGEGLWRVVQVTYRSIGFPM